MENKIDDLDDFVYRFFEMYRISEEASMEIHPEDYTNDDKEEIEREISHWLNEYSIIKNGWFVRTLKNFITKYLNTQNKDKDYWDGVIASNEEMAHRFTSELFDYIKKEFLK